MAPVFWIAADDDVDGINKQVVIRLHYFVLFLSRTADTQMPDNSKYLNKSQKQKNKTITITKTNLVET